MLDRLKEGIDVGSSCTPRKPVMKTWWENRGIRFWGYAQGREDHCGIVDWNKNHCRGGLLFHHPHPNSDTNYAMWKRQSARQLRPHMGTLLAAHTDWKRLKKKDSTHPNPSPVFLFPVFFLHLTPFAASLFSFAPNTPHSSPFLDFHPDFPSPCPIHSLLLLHFASLNLTGGYIF